MTEQVDADFADLLEGFNPEKGGTRRKIAAYVVREIQVRLAAGKGQPQPTGLFPRSHLTASARSPDQRHRGVRKETVLQEFLAKEIGSRQRLLIDIMEDHTQGDGRFIVEGDVLALVGAGREVQTQTLFDIPIARELTGKEMQKIRAAQF